MKQKSKPLEFLDKVQQDTKLGIQVFEAVEKNNLAMAKDILAIAKKAGYSFTGAEFETEVRKDIERRFAAGDISVASAISKKRVSEALESSCAKGCLSYTTTYHPDPAVVKALGRLTKK